MNAEIFENLDVVNKYNSAKNQIVSDVNFVSFLQDNRFYPESLKNLITNNFQYINQEDLYHLAIVRDKMSILNKKFDKLEIVTKQSKISNKPGCNFLYFLPEKKYQAHRFLNNDFNRMIYSIKQLSFFEGNSYPDLNDLFEINETKVSVGHFTYNKEYKNVKVNCD